MNFSGSNVDDLGAEYGSGGTGWLYTGSMPRINWRKQAEELGIGAAYGALEDLRKRGGAAERALTVAIPPELKRAFGLTSSQTYASPDQVEATLRTTLAHRGSMDQMIGQVTWAITTTEAEPLAGGDGSAFGFGENWMKRVERAAKSELLHLDDQTTIRNRSSELICTIASSLSTNLHQQDPYDQFVDGVLAYAKALSDEGRDPALVELRNNISHTLHALCFHEQQITLGEYALQSARFLRSEHTELSIMIDELGWTRYLLGYNSGIESIDEAIRRLDNIEGHGKLTPALRVVATKAYRHRGVILSASSPQESATAFDRAETLANGIESVSQKQANLAHIAFARAQAIATRYGISHHGQLDLSDMTAVGEVDDAIQLVRDTLHEYEELEDVGRQTKCRYLEVRLLRARQRDDEARLVEPDLNRLLKTSIWSRPDAMNYIAGRPDEERHG